MLCEIKPAADDVAKLARDIDGLERVIGGQPGFALEYQPIVALQGGQVIGFETTLRHVPAALPGLAHACVEARYWLGRRVTIDVSGHDLESGMLLEQVDAALAVSGLVPWLLEIELSEQSRLSPPLAQLRALRARGVGVVLGGFGTSEASFDVLRRWPWTVVKLGRVLVEALPFDPEAGRKARKMLDSAEAAGCRCRADGLESLAQRDFLIRSGCQDAQGPLYGRPMPPEQIVAMLDYSVDTCSPPRSGSETPDDRAVPH